MDSSQSPLKKIWKNRFWLISTMITLIPMVVLILGIRHLGQTTSTRLSEIERSYQSVSSVAHIENHPNKTFHQEQQKLNDQLGEAVGVAWGQKYENQVDHILSWPDELKEDFLEYAENLLPFEEKVLYEPTGRERGGSFTLGQGPGRISLPVQLRDRYAVYIHIQDELPKLADIVQARWEGDDRRSEEEDQEEPPLVVWDRANQMEIVENHFDWSDRNPSRPTTLEICYAQEDLWVLRALLEIISQTNANIDARHNLIVKDISYIHVGRMAGMPAAGISQIVSTNSSGGYAEESSSFNDDEEWGERSELADSDHPSQGRYVNSDYEPLSAEELWTALSAENLANDGSELDPELAYLWVAKRMPIRLGLVMDQRHITRLLTECGNSSLTVEPRQVRINPSARGASSGSNYREDDYNAWGSSEGFEEEDFESYSDANSGNRPYDVSVEIYGIIYIYNPITDIKRERLQLTDDAAALEGAEE